MPYVSWFPLCRLSPSQCPATCRGIVLVGTQAPKSTADGSFAPSALDNTKMTEEKPPPKARREASSLTPFLLVLCVFFPHLFKTKQFQLLNSMVFLHQGPVELNQSAFNFFAQGELKFGVGVEGGGRGRLLY